MSYLRQLRHEPGFQPSKVLRTIVGGLFIGLPVIPLVPSSASAQLNPCPRVYYEPPFNRLTQVPPGCSPNAAPPPSTEQTPSAPPSETPAQPSAPAAPQGSTTRVTPNTGGINLTLINQTNVTVIFRVLVGPNQTASMGIVSQGAITLHNLAAPVNVAFVRPDGGILQLNPRVVAPDALEVTLSEATNNATFTGGALNIQADGSIFLNQ